MPGHMRALVFQSHPNGQSILLCLHLHLCMSIALMLPMSRRKVRLQGFNAAFRAFGAA